MERDQVVIAGLGKKGDRTRAKKRESSKEKKDVIWGDSEGGEKNRPVLDGPERIFWQDESRVLRHWKNNSEVY